MTHEEFVAAYRQGKLEVRIDAKAAARLVTSRMMLPLFLLPVFGFAVALALTGYLITGILLFVAAFAFRYFVRASARSFILAQCLKDPVFYAQAVESGLLEL